MAFEGAPLVQVAVEPLDPTALPALLRALELLDQADPAVEVAQLDTGEHVLRTCGEVHLERCLVDLRTTFAPDVRLSVSPPIVPFREGVAATTTAAAVEPTVASTANRRCTVSVRAVALPEAVASELSRHRDALRLALQSGRSWLAADRLEAATRAAVGAVAAALGDAGDGWSALRPLSAAPAATCDNLLLASAAAAAALDADGGGALVASVCSGFAIAAKSGPLCDEPMTGVAFVVEAIELRADEEEEEGGEEATADEAAIQAAVDAASMAAAAASVSGQLIGTVHEACRASFLAATTVLLEPLYLCELQATQEYLGKAHAVLSKRRARVTDEELKDGTTIFTVRALLPAVESFGFASDLRKTTSGAAHPQLVFSHFEALEQDPMFVDARTEEEIESRDDGALPSTNLARKLMHDVRRRKGLHVSEDRAVAVATKQRTRARKK